MARKYVSKFFSYPLRNPGPFVYYQSLLSHSSDGAQIVGNAATKYLYGTSNILNESGKYERIRQALDILKASAEQEAQKEAKYLASLQKKLDKYAIDDLPDITTEPYKFIAELNKILRGAEQFEAELKIEQERINTYRRALNKYGSPEKIGEIIKKGGDKEFTSQQLSNALHNISNTIEGRRDKTSSFTTYSSSVRNNSLAGKIAESVILRLIQLHGSKLIDVKNGRFVLNGRQANALVTLIVNDIERQILQNNGEISKKTIEQITNDIYSEKDNSRKEYDNIINKYMQMSDFYLESYSSFSNAVINEDKYQAMMGTARGYHSRGILRKRLAPLNKLIEQEAGKKTPEGKQLASALKEFSKEWAAAAASVQPKFYFNAEADLGSLLLKHGNEILLSGGETKDDVGAISVVYSPDGNKRTEAIMRNLEEKVHNIGRRSLKKNAYKKGTAEEFTENALNMLDSLEEIEKAYSEAATELGISIEDLREITSSFIIHGNVKSYDTIGAKSDAFSGGSIGKNIKEQLANFANLVKMSGYGYTDYDQNWLLSAIINTGAGLIGQDNKEGLEKYLSAFAGMLLFDDAYLMVSKGTQQLINSVGGTTVDNIHLYSLQGVVVPCSFVLYETYNSLSDQLSGIGGNPEDYHGIKTTIHARGAVGKRFSKPEDWVAEREAAISAADIQIQFMGKFLGFLDNLAQALNIG